jgi:hypothetical protein
MAFTKSTDPQADAELGQSIAEAASAAVQEARERHRKNGIPMASWRNGKVVWLDPVTLQEVETPEFAKSLDQSSGSNSEK